MRAAILSASLLLQGCAAVPYLLAAPFVPSFALSVACPNCIEDAEEGPINWRTPEQREEMRAALRARLEVYTASRAPMLGE